MLNRLTANSGPTVSHLAVCCWLALLVSGMGCYDDPKSYFVPGPTAPPEEPPPEPPELASCGTREGPYNVSVFVQPAEAGKVVSTPCGIACTSGGAYCVFGFDVNRSLELQASPAAGFRFVRWRASTPGEPGTFSCDDPASPTCRFVVDRPKSLVAEFASGAGIGKEWDGGAGSSSWFDAANWSPDGVPTRNDAVRIGSGAAVVQAAGSAGSPVVVASLELNGALDAPGQFEVLGAISGTGTLRGGSIVIGASGSIGALQLIGGSLAGPASGPPAVVRVGGASEPSRLAGSSRLFGVTIEVPGTLEVPGGSSLALAPAGNNAGGSSGQLHVLSGGQLRLEGGATVLRSGGRVDDIIVLNEGTVRVAGGASGLPAEFRGGVQNGGTIVVEQPAWIELRQHDGAVQLSNGVELRVTGTGTNTFGPASVIEGSGSSRLVFREGTTRILGRVTLPTPPPSPTIGNLAIERDASVQFEGATLEIARVGVSGGRVSFIGFSSSVASGVGAIVVERNPGATVTIGSGLSVPVVTFRSLSTGDASVLQGNSGAVLRANQFNVEAAQGNLMLRGVSLEAAATDLWGGSILGSSGARMVIGQSLTAGFGINSSAVSIRQERPGLPAEQELEVVNRGRISFRSGVTLAIDACYVQEAGGTIDPVVPGTFVTFSLNDRCPGR